MHEMSSFLREYPGVCTSGRRRIQNRFSTPTGPGFQALFNAT